MANTDVVKAFKDLVAGNMEFSYRVDILYTNLRKQLENRVELNNSVANSPQQEDSSVDPVYIPEKSKDLFNILDKSFSLLSSPFYMARSSYTGALIEGTPERSLLKIHSVLSSINSGRRGSRGMLSDTTPYSEKLMLDEELREDSIEEATVDTIPGLLDQLLEVCSTDDVKSSKRDREEQEEIDTQDSNDTNSSMWDYIKEIFEWEIIRRIFKVVQAFGYRALRVVYVLTRNFGRNAGLKLIEFLEKVLVNSRAINFSAIARYATKKFNIVIPGIGSAIAGSSGAALKVARFILSWPVAVIVDVLLNAESLATTSNEEDVTRDILQNNPYLRSRNVTLQQYMSSISGQESGGNSSAINTRTGAHGLFQIMPANWPEWSREAGLPANSPRTPANQNRVARFKMGKYFNRYHDWDMVSIAWYAGSAAADYAAVHTGWRSERRFTRNQGNGNEPSIVQYVDQVRSRYSSQSGDSMSSLSPTFSEYPGMPLLQPDMPQSSSSLTIKNNTEVVNNSDIFIDYDDSTIVFVN